MRLVSRSVGLGVAGISLIVMLGGCSRAPQTPTPVNVNDAALTLVALTFEAATLSAQSRPPTLPPPIESTPTFALPRLFINTEVQCRSGIGADFKVLATLAAGTMVDMVGKSSADAAWLILVPNSSLTCWVRAQDSSPSGSFQALPEVTPQPGSGEPPAAPVNLSWPFYCSYVDGVLYEITIQLSWVNMAGDANGFRVYRQEAQIADVPVSVTTYTDTSKIVQGTDVTYSVEAYNDAGASSRLSRTIHNACK